MRDTRPNNKRTLQSGRGLYWHTPERSPASATAKQLDKARGSRSPLACLQAPESVPRPRPPLHPHPLPLFLGSGAAARKPGSIPDGLGHLTSVLVCHRFQKGDRGPADPRRVHLSATTCPACPLRRQPGWGARLDRRHEHPPGKLLRPGGSGGAVPGARPSGKHQFTFTFYPGPALADQGNSCPPPAAAAVLSRHPGKRGRAGG